MFANGDHRSQAKMRDKIFEMTPVFQLGIWNAWILMLYYPLIQPFLIMVDKAMGTGEIMKKMGTMPTNKSERRTNSISTYIMILLIGIFCVPAS